MAGILSVNEILKVAMQIEKNGMTLYTHLLTKGFPGTVRILFKALAVAEKRHLERLEEIKARVGKKTSADQKFSGDTQRYLEAIAGENVFQDSSKLKDALKDVRSVGQALKFALSVEYSTIKLFSFLARNVPADVKEVIDQIIQEEHGHVRQIKQYQRTSSFPWSLFQK